MKKSILFLVLASLSLTASAKSLVLSLNNGTEVYYQLSATSKPMMYLADGLVSVNADTYQFSGIHHFYISNQDAPASLDTPAEMRPTLLGNTLILPASAAPSLRVCTADGLPVSFDLAIEGDQCRAHLAPTEGQILVVSFQNTSFRIARMAQ